MASKDNKTSKTARVMNLMSKKQDPAATEAAETPAAAVPPIVSSLAPDAAVSVQIKNALEDALEGSVEPQAAPAAAPAEQPSSPVQEEAPAPEAAPVPEPAPQPEPEPEPQPTAEEHPVQEEETASPFADAVLPSYPGYMNVMQVLVEEKAPKYIQMFGLCQCARCLEDVKALTLNNLPPKYVVLEQGDMIPRLTVYECNFSIDITAQLLQACKLVMERPHHSR